MCRIQDNIQKSVTLLFNINEQVEFEIKIAIQFLYYNSILTSNKEIILLARKKKYVGINQEIQEKTTNL